MRVAVPFAAAALLAAAPAAAQIPLSPLPPVTLAVTGGTLGIGPEISYRPVPIVGFRASATFLKFDGHGSTSDYRYDGNARLSNFGGFIDITPPLAGGLRLSAGARYVGGNRIRFDGRARSARTFGTVTYTPEQVGMLSGRIRTKDVAPIATAGFQKSTLLGLTFGIDGGVMFHGRPRADDFIATGQLATNPLAQAERARQQQRIADKVDGYKYYPVLQLNVGYRF